MTVVLDRLVGEGVREYNEPMEEEPLEVLMEKLASRVSYFTLQKVDEGWFLSYVDTEPQEMEGENLEELITNASEIVFPASPEDQSEVQESSALPVPENQ